MKTPKHMQMLIQESAAVLRRAHRRVKRYAEGMRGVAHHPVLLNGEVLGFKEELLSLPGPRTNGKSKNKAQAETRPGVVQALELAQFAHDLDNLLMVIANRADLARVDGDGNGSIENSLMAIKSAVQQALDLSQLLRDADQQSAIYKTPVDLTEVVRLAVNHARTWMPGDVALVEDLPVHPPIWILGHSTQLQRVVRNLLSNAVHALRGGGRIVVSIEKVRFEIGGSLFDRSEQLGDGLQRARLRICDNGLGMDRNTRDRIFEAGFSRREGGYGLGMTIVSDIICDHCGTIEVESAPGRGSQIGVSFPLVRDERLGLNDEHRIEP